MTDKESGIDSYLRESEQGGQLHSEGHFTLFREKALEKLSEFQLGGDAEWVLKVVQSVVREGSSDFLEVKLGARSTTFDFQTCHWTFDAIESAFCNPGVDKHSALGHLVRGLWPVGLGQKRSFEIQLSGSLETLIWDGAKLSKSESGSAARRTRLTVATTAENSTTWIGSMGSSAKVNKSLNDAFRLYCHTCPIRLTVDGQRVDSLFHNPNYGWSSKTFPLTLGYLEGSSPELSLPPGTFHKTKRPLHEKDLAESALTRRPQGCKYHKLARVVTEFVEPRPSATGAFLTAFTVEVVRLSKNSVAYDFQKAPSTIYWVLDGVIVESELWSERKTECALGCFLSAEGLETDLTTLCLVESAEKERRSEWAKECVLSSLMEAHSNPKPTEVAEAEKTLTGRSRFWGYLTVAGGLGASILFAPALVLSLFGASKLALAGKEEKRSLDALLRRVQSSAKELSEGPNPERLRS